VPNDGPPDGDDGDACESDLDSEAETECGVYDERADDGVVDMMDGVGMSSDDAEVLDDKAYHG
jgi:hypothetical protein